MCVGRVAVDVTGRLPGGRGASDGRGRRKKWWTRPSELCDDRIVNYPAGMGSRRRRGSDEHHEFEDMAVAHVVGGLSMDEGRLFRSHLLECAACRARVGELRAIAHDLADVERDERRERAAKRTETKARESEESEVAAPVSPRLRTRTTLLLAAGLTVLMALSSWNFLLRGRLQEAQAEATRLRASATVLQLGQPWQTITTSGAEGEVRTRDDKLVIRVDGLAAEASYWLYVYDARGEEIHVSAATTQDAVLYEYRSDLPTAARIEVVRAARPTRPATGTTVFEARRPTESAPQAEAGDAPQLEAVGDSGG